jgi:ABC-type Mn2+/Zn2+ transport system ATPase subunit
VLNYDWFQARAPSCTPGARIRLDLGDTMDSLFLSSVIVQNFRAFHHLRVDRFERVNLVVGKNNVGKSTLLEAIWLYACRGASNVIWQILDSRDESTPPNGANRPNTASDQEDLEDALTNVKSLFYGRKEIRKKSGILSIGPVNSDDKKLSVWVEPYVSGQPRLLFDDASRAEYAFHAAYGREDAEIYPLSRHSARRIEPRRDMPAHPCAYIPSNGIGVSQIEKWWDDITLRPSEGDVLLALKIIAPQVERLSLVARQSSRTFPIVKIAGMDEPVPLRSLGEGMNRLLGIAMAIANTRDGVLLIDEIDTGLHYSIQPQVWKLIFETAERLNVQVFATTHSLDCIRAFQQISRAHVDKGMLISLRARKDNPSDIVSVPYDEDKLEAATQEQLEVR